MKGNELDELFRQKLSHRKLTPPTGSWDKIENNLSEKKSKGIVYWVAIAASMVLIFTLGWLLLPKGETNSADTQQLAEIKTPETKEEVTNEQLVVNKNQRGSEETTATDNKSLPIDAEPKQSLSPAQIAPKTILASNDNEIREAESMIEHVDRIAMTEVSQLSLDRAVGFQSIRPDFNQTVLPLDVSLMHTYMEEGEYELRNKKKFRLMNGIISIAKGVNKSQIGLEKLRNAKNDFISDELKYGVQQTDEEKEEDKPKETKDSTNADQEFK